MARKAAEDRRKQEEDRRKQEKNKNAILTLKNSIKQNKSTPVSPKLKLKAKGKVKVKAQTTTSSYIKYIKSRTRYIYKLLGVSFDANNIKYKKLGSKYKSLNRLYYASFTMLKKQKIKKNKWRAIGLYGSFYKDSKFLSFFMHEMKLTKLKNKLRFVLYYQLHRYFDLFSNYLLRFVPTNLFYKLKLILYNTVFCKYQYQKTNLFINKHIHVKYVERLFSFFNTLGHVYIEYKSQLTPIVDKCISRVHYDEFSTLGNSLSNINMKVRG